VIAEEAMGHVALVAQRSWDLNLDFYIASFTCCALVEIELYGADTG